MSASGDRRPRRPHPRVARARAAECPARWTTTTPTAPSAVLGPLARSALLAIALLVCGALSAQAQLGRKSWEFHPHIGVFLPSVAEFLENVQGFDGFDPGVLWGIYATYHYTDHVGVELGFSKATANGPEPDTFLFSPDSPASLRVGDVGFDFWELNGFVNSGALAPVQVFATAGGGLVNYDPEHGGGVTRLLLDGGIGVRYYAWKNIALRGEVKDFVFVGAEPADFGTPECPVEPAGEGGFCEPGDSPPGEDTLHNIGFFAGLTFNF